jgi:hypothetical protein
MINFRDLQNLKELDKDDILAALGLQTRTSTAGWLAGSLGIFGVGLLVGAGVSLLLAPKTGRELRQELTQRLRKETVNGQSLEGSL